MLGPAAVGTAAAAAVGVDWYDDNDGSEPTEGRGADGRMIIE